MVNNNNNFSISLEPDSLAETERIFAGLSEGSSDVTPLEKMFWGAYWSSFLDRFGVRWMVSFTE